MGFCANCGTELLDGAKFCHVCGCPVISAHSDSQRQQEYAGKIIKCPYCGEILQSFVTICPSCGRELRDVENSRAISEFGKTLAQTKDEKERITIIRNFPIPNTKEDILEFLILASTNINENQNYDDEISDAWRAKIEQAYQKARLTFPNEEEFSRASTIYTEVINQFDQAKREKRQQGRKAMWSGILPILPNVIAIIICLALIFALIPFCRINLDNVGTNMYQLLLILLFVVEAILLPFLCRSNATSPKLIIVVGLVLSMIVMIPLCGKDLDNVGTNMFQLLLICDIIITAIVLVRIFKKRKNKDAKEKNVAEQYQSVLVVMVIAVIIFLGVYAIASIMAPVIENKTVEEENAKYEIEYEWPSSGYSQYLPIPSITYGKILQNDDDGFEIELYKATQEDFNNYVNACEVQGFAMDETVSDILFQSYNNEEFYLDIYFYEKKNKINISLEPPMQMTEIRWPTTTLVKQLPKPSSFVGNIMIDNSECFYVYLSGFTTDAFNDYIDACMEKGFTVDYSRGDTYFHAYNKKGYYLYLEQEPFDKMSIDIKAPDDN